MTYGVPQGSVLGPQEFIAYTEDIACLFETHETEYHLYADDRQLLMPTLQTLRQLLIDRSNALRLYVNGAFLDDCRLIR